MALVALPPEVIEAIITYLDLDAIKSLRLVNKSLAEKCIGPQFLQSIPQPIVDVSPQTLRSLHALSCNPALSKMIHSVTFLATNLDSHELEENVRSGKHIVRESRGPICSVTTVSYTPEELADAQADLDWLKERQKSRANESSSEMIELLQSALKKFGELSSIQLDAAVVFGRKQQRESPRKGKWHPLWMRASRVFSLVVAAVARSGVSLKRLNAYQSTPRCNIPAGHITAFISSFDSEQLETLKSLEALELSMSAEVRPALDIAEPDTATLSDYEKASRKLFGSSEEYLFSHDDPRAALTDETPGITTILKSTPALRELDLSFRRAVRGLKLNGYDRIIETIANETLFPQLESCAFRGFLAKGESILLFLQNHPDLRSLTLHECVLTTGSWTPIFAHLEKSMPRLETLSLSNLFGKYRGNKKDDESSDSQSQVNSGSAENEDTDADEEEKEKEELNGMVNLEPIWDNTPSKRGTMYYTEEGIRVHTREFTREDLKKGLVFRPLGPGRPMGSPELHRWITAREAYGPP